MTTIAHVWWDYLPKTFIEPHSFLLDDGRYRSIVLAPTLYDNGSPIDEYTHFQTRFPLRQLDAPTFLRRVRNRLLRPWKDRKSARFVRRKVRETAPSLLHIHFGTTAAHLVDVVRRSKVPTMVSFYGVDASAGFRDPACLQRYQQLFPLVDRFIVLCEPVKQRLVDHGCDPGKVVVWNMPAGVEKFPYQARRGEVPAGDPVRFIMAARYVEKKGHSFVLRALRKLLDSGKKAELLLVGYGPLLPAVREQVAELGLSAHVRIEDTETKPNFATLYNELLQSQDIFVLPSTTAKSGDDEGGPALTLVCAQAAGLPVICTPFPGSEITVVEGDSGLFCGEDDSDSLAERMGYLVDHPELWNRLGKRGSEIVRSQFSEGTQIARLFDVYEELLWKRTKQATRPGKNI